MQRNVGTQARVDEVTAKQGEARGNLLAQKAALEKAQLQLSYTDITAPIAGRIGRANISVGNFVGPNSGTLATIVSQDPIYVSFPVTQREILAVRKEQGMVKPAEFVIYLQLADGSRYASPGKLNFLDVTVNQGTDTVQVRATFANPNRILVDGQLVNVVAELGKGESTLQVSAAGFAARSIRHLRPGRRQGQQGAGPPGRNRPACRHRHIRAQRPERRRHGDHRGHPEGASRPGRAGDRSQAGV